MSPYLTVQEVAPADGASDFPRNGALQARLKVWPGDGTFPVAAVSVEVENVDTGELVAGTLDNEDLFRGIVNWIPRAPLAAKQRYRMRVNSAEQRRSDITSDPTTSLTTFTTSAELAPDLQLSGKLEITAHPGTVPMLKCGPCGDCVEIGRRPAVVADVVMPTVSGGFSANGYKAWLTLNDAAAPDFSGPGIGKLTGQHIIVLSAFFKPTPGMPLTHTLELPREDAPYVACFGFNAWDPIGQFESAQPVCLSKNEVEAAFEQLDHPTKMSTSMNTKVDAGTTMPTPTLADAAQPREPMHDEVDAGEAQTPSVRDEPAPTPAAAVSSGCSTSPGSHAGTPALALVAFTMLAYGRRRSRPRTH